MVSTKDRLRIVERNLMVCINDIDERLKRLENLVEAQQKQLVQFQVFVNETGGI